jgi:hypothetical protein
MNDQYLFIVTQTEYGVLGRDVVSLYEHITSFRSEDASQ